VDDARDPLTPPPLPATPAGSPPVPLPPHPVDPDSVVPGIPELPQVSVPDAATDQVTKLGLKQWVKNAIMLGVLLVWASYMVITLLQKNIPPLTLWTVPGATYTLLLGKMPKFPGKNGNGS
jgi:hypothetical protein